MTDRSNSGRKSAEKSRDFVYPIIVKPSSSVDYWKHPFDTMKKVYTAATPAEAAEHIKASLDAETGTLILEK